MYTIKDNLKSELIIKNSRFITLLYKVYDDTNVKEIISQTKKKYPHANHFCYAYIIDNKQKVDDDKEPSKTAGRPILNVLKSNNLNYVLAIVVRFFGGIKLGANGLIRAYSNSVSKALKENKLNKLIKGINVEIIFNFNQIKDIDSLLKDIKINDKKFEDNIIYNIDIPLKKLDLIKNNNIKYRIIKDIYIEITDK